MACCAIAIYLFGQLCELVVKAMSFVGIRMPTRTAEHLAAAWRRPIVSA